MNEIIRELLQLVSPPIEKKSAHSASNVISKVDAASSGVESVDAVNEVLLILKNNEQLINLFSLKHPSHTSTP